MAADIFKDVAAIHARFLDHRPILQGHVNKFLKDFEDKHTEENLRKLKNMSTCITEMRDEIIPKCVEVCSSSVTDIRAQLATSVDICRHILEKEKDYSEKPKVDSQQEKRNEDWNKFMADQVAKSAEVDRSFETMCEEVRKHYMASHNSEKTVTNSSS